MATTTTDDKGKDYGDYEEYNKHQSKYGDKYDGACLPKWLEHREYDGKYKYGKDWKEYPNNLLFTESLLHMRLHVKINMKTHSAGGYKIPSSQGPLRQI